MKAILRAVDPEREHPRDLARRLVREREQSKVPHNAITNIHVPEKGRPPSLNVDEVLKKSQPDHIGKKA